MNHTKSFWNVMSLTAVQYVGKKAFKQTKKPTTISLISGRRYQKLRQPPPSTQAHITSWTWAHAIHAKEKRAFNGCSCEGDAWGEKSRKEKNQTSQSKPPQRQTSRGNTAWLSTGLMDPTTLRAHFDLQVKNIYLRVCPIFSNSLPPQTRTPTSAAI